MKLLPRDQQTNPEAADAEGDRPGPANTARHSQQRRSKGPLIIVWILSILTLIFFVLTILYGLNSSAVSRISAFGGSPSRPTIVLRALSEMVSLLMVATISGVLQRLQHLCVVHRIGNWLIGYLTLDPGVGVFGLLGTLFGPGTGWLPARFWNLGRMWFILMIPALSVLVMSKIPFRHSSSQCC